MAYIVRRTNETINGMTVVYHGEKAERLSKGLLDNEGNITDCPLTTQDLKTMCNYSFTKDKKPIYTQIGEAKLQQVRNGSVVGKHRIKWAKDNSESDVIVVWTKQNGGFFPKYKIPADNETFNAVRSL
jgi:hypothetical protein